MKLEGLEPFTDYPRHARARDTAYMGKPFQPFQPPADRWPIVVALLLDPARESRRLIAALGRWQAPARRHSILGEGGRSKADPAPTPADQAQAEPQPKKKRRPLPRGEARFSAKKWAAERAARLAGKDSA